MEDRVNIYDYRTNTLRPSRIKLPTPRNLEEPYNVEYTPMITYGTSYSLVQGWVRQTFPTRWVFAPYWVVNIMKNYFDYPLFHIIASSGFHYTICLDEIFKKPYSPYSTEQESINWLLSATIETTFEIE